MGVTEGSGLSPAGHDGGVTDLDRQTRATSFGSAAEAYARYRPAPPAEAAEVALGLSPGLVIDVAAGTGHLARQLLRTATRVVAVDIDRRMLAILGRRLPGVPRGRGPGRGVALRPGGRRGAGDLLGMALAGPRTSLAGDSPRGPARGDLLGGLQRSRPARGLGRGRSGTPRATTSTSTGTGPEATWTAGDGPWNCRTACRSRPSRSARSPLPCRTR